MAISDQLAEEIYTIVLFNLVAVILVSGFTFYLWLKAKKNNLLFSYMAVVSMLVLWMVSKIFKTVSPNETLRWFFIVAQYLGISYLGYFLVLFAHLYTRGRLPRFPFPQLLMLPPSLGFLVVATNPLHMLFYATYDFYSDSFGPLFFVFQILQYIYLIAGIIQLSRGFTHQPAFAGHRYLGKIFAVIVLIPVLANIYYVLIKLTDLPWVFGFPFFDFTPITSSIALILFMIPAIRFRFLDISPFAYRQIFEHFPSGLAFLTPDGKVYAYNHFYQNMFSGKPLPLHLKEIPEALPFVSPFNQNEFIEWISSSLPAKNFLLQLQPDRTYVVSKYFSKQNHILLLFTDHSVQSNLKKQLEEQNHHLVETHQQLELLAAKSRELARTRIQTKIAQDIHDILGHSLTVVIGTADLASSNKASTDLQLQLSQIKDLLLRSLADLENAMEGKSLGLGYTSLTSAIASLKNDQIRLDFVVQGIVYELNSVGTEAIYRICQEAMTNSIKHGHSQTLSIILRYKADEVELFAIDNGIGCSVIQKGLGLLGMENRITALGGQITFGSDQTEDDSSGFHIHLHLPRSSPSK